jgi:hypothetical protein
LFQKGFLFIGGEESEAPPATTMQDNTIGTFVVIPMHPLMNGARSDADIIRNNIRLQSFALLSLKLFPIF